MISKINLFILFLAGSALLFALLFGAVTGLVATINTADTAYFYPTVDVFVVFEDMPGKSEEALVRAFGGEINHRYHLVPAIAATIPEQARRRLNSHSMILSIEDDGEVTLIGHEAELDNAWSVKRIGAGDVHHDGNLGTDIKVAVVDSGIDHNHPDLVSNYAGGYDFVNNKSDPMDDNGHGTLVAGTVAALMNGFGVVGVAPEARLYGLKVIGSAGSGSWSNVIAALEWAVDNGIQITNNSYGAETNPGSTVEAAFNNSYAAGVLHIAAAGNSGECGGDGDNVRYPARYSSVVAVSATNENDVRPCWSSTGPDVEIVAPGVSISSTLMEGGYGTMSGTSMSSPHVAGVSALVLATGVVDATEVRRILRESADDLGSLSHYGYGLVNAPGAAAIATPPAPPGAGSIDGTVVDASTLDPVADASVTDGTRSALTDVNGHYLLSDVPEGTHIITASADDYHGASQADVVVVENVATTVDFSLQSIVKGSIDGTVVDVGTLEVVAGATVTDGTRSSTTDSAGYYLLSDVPEGTYTVIASANGYKGVSQEVGVAGDEVANFFLQSLSPEVDSSMLVGSIDYSTHGGRNRNRHLTVTVAIIDSGGNPVSDASVSIALSNELGGDWAGTDTTNSDGVAFISLNNAPTGCYETKINNVSTDGFLWDGITPDNRFCR